MLGLSLQSERYLEVRGTSSWLHSCNYDLLVRPISRVSQVITGLQVESEPSSYKYPEPPSRGSRCVTSAGNSEESKGVPEQSFGRAVPSFSANSFGALKLKSHRHPRQEAES